MVLYRFGINKGGDFGSNFLPKLTESLLLQGKRILKTVLDFFSFYVIVSLCSVTGIIFEGTVVMIDAKQCCLVVVDVQEKLTAVMSEREGVVRNCSILVQAAKALEMPILWCQQAPLALGETVEGLREHLAGIEPINKTSFSCGGEPAFMEALAKAGTQTAILCGIEAHVCVWQTAADLMKRGHKVQVVADAVTSRTEANKQIALARMAREGVTVTSSEMLLFELLRNAKHPQFRTLAKLIK